MKKMRGVVDPITLGFILAALITIGGEATVAKIAAQEKAAQAQQAPVPTVSVELSDK